MKLGLKKGKVSEDGRVSYKEKMNRNEWVNYRKKMSFAEWKLVANLCELRKNRGGMLGKCYMSHFR